MAEKRNYIVSVPIRGVQTYLVEAMSAEEAKRIADCSGMEDEDVCYALGFEVTQRYKANYAKADW